MMKKMTNSLKDNRKEENMISKSVTEKEPNKI